MNEQIQNQKSWQRKSLGSTILMITGLIFMAFCIFVFVTRLGQPFGLGDIRQTLPHGGYAETIPEVDVVLSALAPQCFTLGLMLFLIGLVSTIKNPSLLSLRYFLTIIFLIIIGIAVLWAFLVLVLLFSGF